VWHYLRDPAFSRFHTIPEYDRHTHTDKQTDEQTHDDGMYRGARGHPMSSETSPFDRAHMTYSSLIETSLCVYLVAYRFRVIVRFSSKVANFNPPHLHLSPP